MTEGRHEASFWFNFSGNQKMDAVTEKLLVDIGNDIDASIHTSVDAIINGAVVTMGEIKAKAELSSYRVMDFANKHPQVFSSYFSHLMSPFVGHKTTIIANGETFRVKTLMTVTTRGGTVECPCYMYVNNPTRDVQDTVSHLLLKKRNIDACVAELLYYQKLASAQFGALPGYEPLKAIQ